MHTPKAIRSTKAPNNIKQNKNNKEKAHTQLYIKKNKIKKSSAGQQQNNPKEKRQDQDKKCHDFIYSVCNNHQHLEDKRNTFSNKNKKRTLPWRACFGDGCTSSPPISSGRTSPLFTKPFPFPSCMPKNVHALQKVTVNWISLRFNV